MVKKRLEKKIKNDPVSVIIVILVFMVLSVAILIYMHLLQNRQIMHLNDQIEYLKTRQVQ